MGRHYTQHVGSKWAKTQVLLRNGKLRRYVPHTRILNKATLRSMINRYGMVYVKPNRGTSGIGVAKVERLEQSGNYRIRWDTSCLEISSLKRLHRHIRSLSPRRTYLIQKGIRVLRHGDRPFDLRVMVQLSSRRRWRTTGMIGRIAAPDKVVTNRSGGGDIMKVKPLLRPHISVSKRRRLIRELDRIGRRVAGHMKKTYPGIKELGLDVAIDGKLKPWILEVNTTPVVKLFYQLKDKRMISRIIRYGKAYGRTFNNLR